MEDLYDQIKRAAEGAGLYAVESYGWLNENDADPEFLGHAMWQTEQPMLAESTDAPLSRVDVELLTAGEDFYGLMEAARIAAGLAVFRLPHVSGQPFHNDHLFWSQTLQAVIALGTATDRLREFARIGFRGGWPKRSGNTGEWEVPFGAAATLVSTAPPFVRDAGVRLQSVGAILHHRRKVRHEAVHELATKVAKSTNELATHVHEHGRRALEVEHLPYEEIQRRYEDGHAAVLREHREAIEQIKSWYLLLVRASSDTFIVENWIRRQAERSAGG